MFYLIYISSAAELMDEENLLLLLDQIRPINLSLGVTGMLVYQDGSFMQMLEGDNRHKGVMTMMRGILKKEILKIGLWVFVIWIKERDLPKFGDYLHENLSLKKFQDDSQNAYRFMVKFNGLS